MTIITAVTMVGTPEDEGVLDRTTKMFAAERNSVADDAQIYAEGQSLGNAPSPDSDAGWGISGPVFGEYAPGATGAPASGSRQTLPTGTIIPGPLPVVPDNEGIPLSDTESGGGQPAIIDRELNIQPH